MTTSHQKQIQTDWIADVFYDLLPKHGYEIREEQVYTAFQIATAMNQKKVHMAEAGLGTGKTFAYLLSGLAYARLTGRPVVIACASATLQEQLVGPYSDIAILSRILNLNIDARLAKHPSQYLCNVKMERVNSLAGQIDEGLAQILEWARTTRLGERTEIPELPDSVWNQMAWDEFLSCDTCYSRGYCRLIKARAHYRAAGDFVICDHTVFFEDLWMRQDQIAAGKLPLLPLYSAVIFDEGHKVLLPAAKAAGQHLVLDDLMDILLQLEEVQAARSALLAAVLASEEALTRFQTNLEAALVNDERSTRLTVRTSAKLQAAAVTLHRVLQAFYHELVTEQALHIQVLPDVYLEIYGERLERFDRGLTLLTQKDRQTIAWVERADRSLWVIPQALGELFQKHLFDIQIPVIFSSGTLSNAGDFSYLASSLGLDQPAVSRLTTSSVPSPFDYQNQVLVYLPQDLPAATTAAWFEAALQCLVSLLQLSRGRALVLTDSIAEVRQIREYLAKEPLVYQVLWEDQADRSYLVQTFKDDVTSVLVGTSFWEGIDIPGEALSLLVVWRLPFPPSDPLLDAQRQDDVKKGLNPELTIDYPEMALRLKQGCGRLIRSASDRGVIAVLEPGSPWADFVWGSFPPDAATTGQLSQVNRFFKATPE